ncbi:MAG TPA: mobile mystery protein B [Pyrinomonadaceae bacterium]|nr:mobile mystery protein B [Pyrinomonadaceae bacterium]
MSDKTKTPGATPGDDTSGLIQRQLTDRRARNAAELDAISRAYNKHIYRARRKRAGTEWLTDELIRRVHFDMFGEIWEWAGKYRTDSVNIGVDFHLIPEQIKLLCGDFNYWNSDRGAMPPLEIAVRLQNRLTRIHPFINGNGRHARLITDIFFHSVKHPLPKWPQIQLMSEGDQVRARYIEAMKAADKEDYRELMAFMKEFVE